MAFWRVAGFAQPSPIEQILDKEEYTLEELLDEDDIIQECKSLNGRLIAFLREKAAVEQLLRYLVQPPSDPDDPKKQYKYPFTACEVFCCEVEAVFNTLLEDEALLGLLFSLVDAEPPLSCKAAGYFGRVVGQLLVRKPNEMMQYLSNHDELLGKMVRHLDVTSIADVIKRLAGADEQSAMVFMPMHTQWLVETPLLDMLLERLGPGWPGDAVTNAADVLTAIAHTQPSALSTKLMQPASISSLFRRALEPGGQVIVPALEVCSALLRPRRGPGPDDGAGGSPTASGGGGDCGAAFGGGDGPGGGGEGGPSSGGGRSSGGALAAQPRIEAMGAMLAYLPQLVSFLSSQDAGQTQEAPYGLLAPPLGRARLKVVELLAVLLHVGDEGVEGALIAANAMGLVLQLFAQYPFNNLLHHQVFSMLEGVVARASPPMVAHTFGACRLVAWLSGLPSEVLPQPRPSGPPPKGPLRAGYLGHVTQIANLVAEAAAQKQAVADALVGDEAWLAFAGGELRRRNEVEDLSNWECGRPASTDMAELGSDGDDFQNDMDLEQMQGMQPALYHRYGVLDDNDDEEDDEAGGGGGSGSPRGGMGGAAGEGDGAARGAGGGGGEYGGGGYGTMLAAAMQNMDISDAGGGGDKGAGAGAAGAGEGGRVGGAGQEPSAAAGHEGGGAQAAESGWSLLGHEGGPGPGPAAAAAAGERGMEDDAVLFATSDDEDGGGSPVRGGAAGPGPGAAAGAGAGGSPGPGPGAPPQPQPAPALASEPLGGMGEAAGPGPAAEDAEMELAGPSVEAEAAGRAESAEGGPARGAAAGAGPGLSGGGEAGKDGGGVLPTDGGGDQAESEGFTDHAAWGQPSPMDVREGGT